LWPSTPSQKARIGADFGESADAPHGFLEPVGRARIGPRHDQNVGAFLARIDRRLNTQKRLVARDHLLAARMAAAFRRKLVFDHRAGKAGLGIAADSAFDVERVAVTGVRVADHGNRHGVADIAPLFEHLRIGNQPRIRHTQPCRRDSEAAHKTRPEPGAFDDPGRQRVETGRRQDDARFRQTLAQLLRR
jgi:hypothetical protein